MQNQQNGNGEAEPLEDADAGREADKGGEPDIAGAEQDADEDLTPKDGDEPDVPLTEEEEKDAAAKARVKEAILTTRLNLKQFAREINMAYPTLRDYFSGLRKPGFDALASIASYTGVSAEWLLLGKGVMFPHDLTPMNTVDEKLLGVIVRQVALASAELDGEMVAEDGLGDADYSIARRERLKQVNKAQEQALLAANVYNRVSLIEDEEIRGARMIQEVKSLLELYRNMHRAVEDDAC